MTRACYRRPCGLRGCSVRRHAQAKASGATISELVRSAAREHYLGKRDERKKAMQAFAGLRKDRAHLHDIAAYVRGLRRGKRLDRLAKP